VRRTGAVALPHLVVGLYVAALPIEVPET